MEISRLLSGNQLEESRETQKNGKIYRKGVQHVLTKRKRRWRPSLQQIRDKNQRDADNSLLLNLTLDVNDLRQQVHDCLVQKSLHETRLLVSRQQFLARSLQSVAHFFQLFRHGYPSGLTPTEESYLCGLLDEAIDVGGGLTGRTEFYEQWRRYKQLFSVRRIWNFSAEVVTSDARGCLIECFGEFEGQVTAAALETVFPHVLEDEALVEQVLHRRFVCPTKTLISVDSDGRVVQYDAFSDVFEAMSKLLDCDPFQVVRLMTGAVISEGSLLPPVDNCIEQAGDREHGDEANQQEWEARSVSLVRTSASRSSIDFILS